MKEIIGPKWPKAGLLQALRIDAISGYRYVLSEAVEQQQIEDWDEHQADPEADTHSTERLSTIQEDSQEDASSNSSVRNETLQLFASTHFEDVVQLDYETLRVVYDAFQEELKEMPEEDHECQIFEDDDNNIIFRPRQHRHRRGD